MSSSPLATLIEQLKTINPKQQNLSRIISKGSSDKWPKELKIATDGASRGNPGPASIGLIVFNTKEEEIYQESVFLGNTYTNNIAEYSAMFRALYLSVKNHVLNITLKSDSQFLIRQLLGQYKVKSKNIIPLYLACQELIKQIPKIELQHVLRADNKKADLTANLILNHNI